MKINFLGTNGWYDTDTGNTVCVLIEEKTGYLILDAGSGIYKIDRYIKNKKPIRLFISHFHLDHIFGLHILAKFKFSQGIDIYGPKGLEKMFKTIINKPYSAPIDILKTSIRLHELDKDMLLPVKLEFGELRHSSLCYGYRFFIENKIISYCTDTGICDNLFKLAEKADLLISECSLKQSKRNDEWPHLTPQDCASVAKKAGVKRLCMVHFDAAIYKNMADRKAAQGAARNIFKNTLAARDDMSIEI